MDHDDEYQVWASDPSVRVSGLQARVQSKPTSWRASNWLLRSPSEHREQAAWLVRRTPR